MRKCKRRIERDIDEWHGETEIQIHYDIEEEDWQHFKQQILEGKVGK